MPHLHNQQPQHLTPPEPLSPPPPQIWPIQTRITYPGEDWQVDFTGMLTVLCNFKHLSVLVNRRFGWTEVSPAIIEIAAEVSKALLKEITTLFLLPGSLQCSNGLSGEGGNKYPGRNRPCTQPGDHGCRGKEERSNQTLNWALVKLC